MKASHIKRIGILTSGGDAPGMNAAIRATVLKARHHGIHTIGFKHGYNGLLNNEYVDILPSDVRNVIHRGGTILKSARCAEFQSEEGARSAAAVLEQHNLDGLVVIGGNGSYRGLEHLSRFWKGQVVGVPGTIDNDIGGTERTIGFATAVDTAVNAIDKIRDTADAFDSTFLVEVMGRHSGYIALDCALSTGAEQVFLPEVHDGRMEELIHAVCTHIQKTQEQRGHGSYVMVTAENLWHKGTADLAQQITLGSGITCKPCVLGHIQRGGDPCVEDRLLATRMGAEAVASLIRGESLKAISLEKGDLVSKELELAFSSKCLEKDYMALQFDAFDALKLKS